MAWIATSSSSAPLSGSFSEIQRTMPLFGTSIRKRQFQRFVGTTRVACEMAKTQRRFNSALNDPVAVAKLQAELEEMKAKVRAMEAAAMAGNAIPRITNAGQLLQHFETTLPQRRGTKTEDRLSRLVKCFDSDRLEREVRNCVTVVADSMCKRDKEYHPMPVVIGTAGQGKTEMLYWITGQYPEAVDAPLIMRNGPSIIRERFAAKFETMDPNDARVDPDPICLFATFNQDSVFADSELPDIEAALTSRVAAWYTQRQWDVTLTKVTGCSLRALITEIRRKAEEEKGERKVVILAVDELRKISEPAKRSQLLDTLAGLSQAENQEKRPLFPIVSCLDAAGVFSVNTETRRSLQPITLLPCPPSDIDDLLDELAQRKWPGWDRAFVRHQLFSTNGHYRSLEMLAGRKSVTAGSWTAFAAQVAVLRMIYKHRSMLPKVEEATVIDPDGKSQDRPSTLYQCASEEHYGIFYGEVDVQNKQVTPRLNMMIVANSIHDLPDNTKVPLSDLLLSIIHKMGKVLAEKEIELIVPQLLVLRAFLQDAPWIVDDLLSIAIRTDKGVTVKNPWFIGWEPSDPGRLCTRKLTLDDLKGINLTEATGENWLTGDEVIKAGAKCRSGVRFAFPKVSNYPGIEGVVFGLLSDATDGTKQYSLAVQMKCQANAKPCHLVEWARSAHRQMKKLEFREGEYYVLLCLTSLPDSTPDLPKGTLVVGLQFLEALCRPFGLESAVLDTIRNKQGSTTQDTLPDEKTAG
jgi:hypothetical protein